MENNQNRRNEENDNYEQRFLSELKKAEGDAVQKSKNDSAKRNRLVVWSIMVGVLFVIVVVLGIVLLNGVLSENTDSDDDASNNDFFDADTSMIEVLVAPSTARIMIGGNQYTNGEYELTPGEYEVSIEEAGFEPYYATIIVSDKHKTYVTTCLHPVNGNENYYDDNPEQYVICQTSDEMVDVSAWDQNALTDQIFEYTPFHNDKGGFYVDPYYNNDNELVVEITFKDCSQEATVLEQRAYDWMREQSLNPEDYTIETAWDCEE